MYWTLELASHLEDAPWPATKDELIDYAIRSGAPVEVVENLQENFNTVAVFSHNPGITEFVNMLTDDVRLDNMPTCGVFAVRTHSPSWKNFTKAKKEFFFFDYPKNI